MRTHFLVVILLYDRSSNYHINSISIDYMVEFFKNMLDTLDSAKGSRKEDVRMLQIHLIFISFEVWTLNYCVYILSYSELFQNSLCDWGHSLTDRNNALTLLKALLNFLTLLTSKGVICIRTCNYQDVGHLHSHPYGWVSGCVDYSSWPAYIDTKD